MLVITQGYSTGSGHKLITQGYSISAAVAGEPDIITVSAPSWSAAVSAPAWSVMVSAPAWTATVSVPSWSATVEEGP